MTPKKEQLEAYKAMAKESSRDMEKCIRRHLEENCPKFKGNEERFEGCIKYVEDCAREILGSRHCGDVADDACYRMARDYFDDELWKAEEEEKAKEEEFSRKKQEEAAAKKAAIEAKKKAAEEKKKALEAKKAEIARKKAEREAQKQAALLAKKKAEEERLAAIESKRAEQEKVAAMAPEPGQLDFFTLMGV